MFRFLSSIAAIAVLLAPLSAQVTARRPVVRASGEGIVSVRPDQVKVTINVSTGANTATEAADVNASETTKVMGALRGTLGATAEIRTVGYSLSPRYNNNTRTYDGFTASNSVEVTISDLNMAGRAVDTAAGNGATSIGGIRFTLKDANPSRMQALRLATIQARQNAEAIASGLGKSLGNVVIAQDSYAVSVTPVDVRLGAGAAATPTPIEPGNVDVRATVSIEAEMN